MSKFVRNIEIKKTFEGDEVTVIVRPMTTADAFGLNIGNVDELIKKLGTYIVSLTGLKDAANAEVDIQTMLDSAYFMPLLGEIASDWAEYSLPKKEKLSPSAK